MLNIRSERMLANILGVPLWRLHSDLKTLGRCYMEYYLINPARPGKRREILEIRGHWKRYLDKLYTRILLPALRPSIHSHGGVKGRSIVSNANAHRNSIYVFNADIADFFPSIHYERVYKLFVEKFDCSANVARICTRLCTHNYHLAVGLQTSPILADKVLDQVDVRIGSACNSAGLIYTRFVDDITITGIFDLQESGFVSLVKKIINQNGFELSPHKQKTGKLSDGIPITSLRLKGENLDVSKLYISNLINQIRDAARLSQGLDSFIGPYYSPDQIFGRIQFACSINPARKGRLFRLCRNIDWKKCNEEAERRGFMAQKNRLIPRSPGQG